MSSTNRKASPELLWKLAENLKRLRKARGLTQEALARRCGYHRTYVSNIESAVLNISLANLEVLAHGLDCSLDDLFMKVPAISSPKWR